MSEQRMVKLYSTNACPWCKKAEQFLKENNINYQHFNVAEDKDARDEMIKSSGQMGVPVIDIDRQIIIGYNETQLREKLGL